MPPRSGPASGQEHDKDAGTSSRSVRAKRGEWQPYSGVARRTVWWASLRAAATTRTMSMGTWRQEAYSAAPAREGALPRSRPSERRSRGDPTRRGSSPPPTPADSPWSRAGWRDERRCGAGATQAPIAGVALDLASRRPRSTAGRAGLSRSVRRPLDMRMGQEGRVRRSGFWAREGGDLPN